MSALFPELARRLHQVVQFDGLALVLHEAASNTMLLHVLETSEPTPHQPVLVLLALPVLGAKRRVPADPVNLLF
jgi:hypothetical protein